ncbi:MAG: glycosyltransferase family 2 protein [Acidobacteriota bacterium]
MNLDEPVVSVLMPVRDGERYIDASIRSILAQSFRQWELIVVDDGSIDATPSLLVKWAQKDSRIRVITQPAMGLVAASNQAVAAARGRYLARLDSDDLAHPSRLAWQVACMERRPQLVAMGSAISLFGERTGLLFTPMTNWGCRGRLLFENCFAHSTTMIRRSMVAHLGPLYEPHTEFAEDLALWMRLAPLGHFANLPFPLVKYRVHPHQTSREKAAILRRKHAIYAITQWASFGVHVSADDFLRFRWPDFGEDRGADVARHSARVAWALRPLWVTRFAPQTLFWTTQILLRNLIKLILPPARRFL